MIDTKTIHVYLLEAGGYYNAIAVTGLPANVEVSALREESFEVALEKLKLALWSFGIDTPIEVKE